jgi:hypothetical protein
MFSLEEKVSVGKFTRKASELTSIYNKPVNNIEEKVIAFFIQNSYPTQSMINNFANKLNISSLQLQSEIYICLSTFLSAGRFNKLSKSENEFNNDEIKKGIKIELEHLDKRSRYSILLAKRITLDHLTEMNDYNTKLLEMEKSNKNS